ncbi:MAG TPA: type III polyketide synthase [Candidatus Dormibacteraeota bacterium]|nr:type III polyketide synthase [Candidatus Dormibacteraeota bacterium]
MTELASISAIATALPEHRLDPERTSDLLCRVFPRLRTVSLQPVTRYSVEPPDQLLRARAVGEAMRLYQRHAPRLAAEACAAALAAAGIAADEIDVVISTSCTGYLCPALDVRLVAGLGMRDDVVRIPLTELGCSGGMTALGLAQRHLEGHPSERVLVVAVELCSLSFQPDDRSIDNLIASMVFGDGAAAAVLTASAPRPGGLELVSTSRRLLPDSAGRLGFDLRDDGFHVVLDPHLPAVIGDRLADAVSGFWTGDAPRFHAVHAGGPRIFDAVERSLHLGEGALASSRRVFDSVGNLSSASILYCLDALPETWGDGLALAFGPGVTVEMARVRRCQG